MGEIREDPMRQVVTVSNTITVRSAHLFSDNLLELFNAEQDVDLDLTELAEVDLAFVEIIYSAREQWARAGRDLRLAQPAGGAVVALLGRAGFLTNLTPQDLDFWFHGELPQ